MVKKETKFIFSYNELLEFQYTFANMACLLADFDKCNEYVSKFHQNEYIEKFRKAIGLLSDYMKSELLYFFSNGNNICDGLGQIILYYKINNNEYSSVVDLYNGINNCADEELIGIVLSYFFHEATNKSFEKTENFLEFIKDYDKVHELALSLEFENENRKKILIDFIENIAEYRQRFSLLLKMLYEKIYINVFGDSYDIVKPLIDSYEKELKADKKAFFHKYMVCDSDIYGEEIYIHISYARFSGGDFWASQTNRREWIVLGCFSEEVIGFDNERDKLFEFLKIIGEKKRLQIIEILRERSSYVDEIASKMGMTAPTASYHLTLLQSFDIVDYERYDHRFYYYLNKEMLVMWLDKIKNYFES